MKLIELDTEKQHLHPNTKLVNIIRRLKNAYPSLRVFYVSDMYLRKSEIEELFSYFKIDIFDSGCMSTETNAAKFNGGLFRLIGSQPILCDSFNIFTNLHIGDNTQSDVRAAREAGSYAISYPISHSRQMTTFINGIKLHCHNKRACSDARRQLINTTRIDRNCSTADAWRRYGLLFSQPLYSYLCHIGITANAQPGTKFILVSSEATLFKDLGGKLLPNQFKAKNIIVANKLNRKTALRALIYQLAMQSDAKRNIRAIVDAACLGEIGGSRREIYDFIFGKDYPYSEFNINKRSDDDFYSGLLNDIIKLNKDRKKAFEAAVAQCLEFIPSDNSPVTFVDVGWGGTVQLLMTEFMKLNGYAGNIRGLYLGCHLGTKNKMTIDRAEMHGYFMTDTFSKIYRPLWNAVLWEYAYTNKIQFPEDAERIANVRKGFSDGLKLFKQTGIDPANYMNKVQYALIKRFINRPTKREVDTIGNIRFDCGFADETYFRIVDKSFSVRQFNYLLLRHPHYMMRQYVFRQNVWPTGYIKYYHLGWLKPIVRIRAKLLRKSSPV